MRCLTLVIAACLASATSPTVSAQAHFGLGLGRASINIDCTGASACDKSGNGGKLLAGYRFAPNLGAELSYHDFGKAESSGPAAAAGSVRATAWGLGLAYVDEVAPRWLAGGRLGVARTRSRLSGVIGPANAAGSKASVQPLLGLVLGYELSPYLTFDVVLDFTRVKVGNVTSNARLLSAGLTYGF